jgi:hypothetical protein
MLLSKRGTMQFRWIRKWEMQHIGLEIRVKRGNGTLSDPRTFKIECSKRAARPGNGTRAQEGDFDRAAHARRMFKP